MITFKKEIISMVLKINRQELLGTFYCFCSEKSHKEILEAQQSNPLKFSDFLDEYTKCNQGCGSCIENLRVYLEETGNYIE
jgi:bacterioferritin-associated ferredoxin